MKKNKRKSRPLFKIIAAICLFILLGIGITMVASNSDVTEQNPKSIYSNLPQVKNQTLEIGEQQPDKSALRILLLIKNQQDGNRDTEPLAVLEIEPKENKMDLSYIPSDGSVGKESKTINSHVSGAGESMKAVEDFLNINLDYYIQVNTAVLGDIVDEVGGITILNDNDRTDQKGVHHAEGELHLDGAQTMDYLQAPEEGAYGQFSQLEHKLQVAEALMKRITGPGAIDLASNMYGLLDKSVKTNMDLEAIIEVLMVAAEFGRDSDLSPVMGE